MMSHHDVFEDLLADEQEPSPALPTEAANDLACWTSNEEMLEAELHADAGPSDVELDLLGDSLAMSERSVHLYESDEDGEENLFDNFEANNPGSRVLIPSHQEPEIDELVRGANTDSACGYDDAQVERASHPVYARKAVKNELVPAAANASVSPLQKIDCMFEQIVDDMLDEKGEISLAINLRARQISHRQATGELEMPVRKTKRICFPGRTPEEAWRFS
jgi:hypothetical protein